VNNILKKKKIATTLVLETLFLNNYLTAEISYIY